MPWRGLLVLVRRAALLAGWVVLDERARLIFAGPVNITEGTVLGVNIGEDENAATRRLRATLGVEPTIIEPEPARELHILPFHRFVFRDRSLYRGWIALDARDGLVFRTTAQYVGPLGREPE